MFVTGMIVAIQLTSSMTQAQTSSMTNSPLLFAAGSLRTAMDEIIVAYQVQDGALFKAKYGPSGNLRQEIEAGVKVDVFASASTEHTEALAQQKLLAASMVFAHNDLCVIARPQLDLREENLLALLANPSVRMATSTPLSDPMGDYTWQFFRNADKQQPGIYQTFNAKALKLSGASMPVAGEKLPYITAFEDNKTDAYIMYCTNAVVTKKALPELNVLRIPNELNVRSAYGIAADEKSEEGKRFVHFVLSSTGQEILKRHGFD